MTYVNLPLMQQVSGISKRERKPDIRHHRQADDLRACREIAEGFGLVILPGYETDLPASGEVPLTPHAQLR
jgi:hypothetical protein